MNSTFFYLRVVELKSTMITFVIDMRLLFGAYLEEDPKVWTLRLILSRALIGERNIIYVTCLYPWAIYVVSLVYLHNNNISRSGPLFVSY